MPPAANFKISLTLKMLICFLIPKLLKNQKHKGRKNLQRDILLIILSRKKIDEHKRDLYRLESNKGSKTLSILSIESLECTLVLII